jgi:hypothetical protein
MQETTEQRELVEKLAEEFVRRYRNGMFPKCPATIRRLRSGI